MPIWPATLPQYFQQEGFADTEPNLFTKTEMDAGPPKVRRRFSAGHRPISGNMIMTSAQKTILRSFYRSYGATQITFPDPDGGAALDVVFMAPPEYAPYAGIDWQVKLQLVVMP